MPDISKLRSRPAPTKEGGMRVSLPTQSTLLRIGLIVCVVMTVVSITITFAVMNATHDALSNLTTQVNIHLSSLHDHTAPITINYSLHVSFGWLWDLIWNRTTLIITLVILVVYMFLKLRRSNRTASEHRSILADTAAPDTTD